MKYTGHIDILVLKKHEASLKHYIEEHTPLVGKWVRNPNQNNSLVHTVVIECALRDHPEWFDTYLSGIREQE